MRSHALATAALPAAPDLPRVVVGIPALWMRALQAALLPVDRAPISVGPLDPGAVGGGVAGVSAGLPAAGGGGDLAVAPGAAAGGGGPGLVGNGAAAGQPGGGVHLARADALAVPGAAGLAAGRTATAGRTPARAHRHRPGRHADPAGRGAHPADAAGVAQRRRAVLHLDRREPATIRSATRRWGRPWCGPTTSPPRRRCSIGLGRWGPAAATWTTTWRWPGPRPAAARMRSGCTGRSPARWSAPDTFKQALERCLRARPAP